MGGRGGGAARVPQEKPPRRPGAWQQPRGGEAAASMAPGGQGLPSTEPAVATARRASRRASGRVSKGSHGAAACLGTALK